MSKTAINSLLKRRTHLKAAIQTLDDKRQPLSAELEGIDAALKALGHVDADPAVDVAAPANAEPHADPSVPQNGTVDDDTGPLPHFLQRGETVKT